MCREVVEIKKKYNYDFSRLLIHDQKDCKTINLEIETIAENLLNNILKNDHNIEHIKANNIAVPIVGISNHFGFKNFDGDFSNLSNNLSQYRNASGMIAINSDFKKIYDSDKILILNKNETLEHSRFTIAHELGHYLFDFNETTQYTYTDFYRTEEAYKDEKEKRASRFAAALLMPKESFINQYNQLKSLTYYEIVNKLSEIFIVSTTAIDLRIKELKELNLL